MKSEENSTELPFPEQYSTTESVEGNKDIPADSTSNQIRLLFLLLLSVSALMVLLSAILKLDYLPGILLGCLLIGLNLHWTIRFVRNLIQERKLQPINLIFYLSKFGFSALALFGALNYYYISPVALLIGLSNIVIAVMVFSVISSLKRTVALESEASKE